MSSFPEILANVVPFVSGNFRILQPGFFFKWKADYYASKFKGDLSRASNGFWEEKEGKVTALSFPDPARRAYPFTIVLTGREP